MVNLSEYDVPNISLRHAECESYTLQSKMAVLNSFKISVFNLEKKSKKKTSLT